LLAIGCHIRIALRARWCNIIVLNVHAPSEECGMCVYVVYQHLSRFCVIRKDPFQANHVICEQCTSGERIEVFVACFPPPLPRGPGYLSRYGDFLRVGRSGDRIPVAVRFSATVQTGPGACPASCTMGAGSLFRGRSIDQPPRLALRLKKE